eukprot:TRINITY_DN16646_c1_g1_i2.p1 TRINITY_DN16646_c1_g1~~TRINITY_DN16646_c1_g1_i2.p1  ORF type:complete len:1021 (-),score=227.83 TRINITY_DN16646_c1_g1_i2:311-3373(-)
MSNHKDAASATDTIPVDPGDPRLTVEGALTDGFGRLLPEAYRDLAEHYESEPAFEDLPVQELPGVRPFEVDCHKRENLRWWKDKGGCGWVAKGDALQKDGRNKTAEKWFSLKKFGSWRLAYLLACLQRDLWELSAEKSTSTSENKLAPTASVKRKSVDPSDRIEAGNGPKKRGRGRPSRAQQQQSVDADGGDDEDVDRLLSLINEDECEDLEAHTADQGKSATATSSTRSSSTSTGNSSSSSSSSKSSAPKPKKQEDVASIDEAASDPESEEIEDVVHKQSLARSRSKPESEAVGLPAQASPKPKGRPKKRESPGAPDTEEKVIEEPTKAQKTEASRSGSRTDGDSLGKDPHDSRLTLEGAVCDCSRLVLSAYNDLKSHFQGELPPSDHPDPLRPGIRLEELPGGANAVSLEGLRNWSDAKGEGWIAYSTKPSTGKSESRWFNARVWGSWRLAFLLAKLQKQVWEKTASGKGALDSDGADSAPQEGTASKGGDASNMVPLTGSHEWLAFSPREKNTTLCLARTWDDGRGGQCQNPRPTGAGFLCLRHQRHAVSKKGLIYGLVDGPIPPAKLEEFQAAALAVGLPSQQEGPQRPRAKTGLKGKKKRGVKKKRQKDKSAEEKTAKTHRRVSTTKATSTPPEPELEQEQQWGRRRGKEQPKTSKAEARQKNQQFWSGVDSAMDAAVAEAKKAHRIDSLLDDDGHIRQEAMAEAVSMMGVLPDAEARHRLALILRATVSANLVSACAFVLSGGVAAVIPWLESALPGEAPSSEVDARKREALVLDCLKLLRHLPVNQAVVQKCRIGSTLMALRCYCLPAQAAVGELITLWKKKFSASSELHQPQSSTPPTPTGASRPSSAAAAPATYTAFARSMASPSRGSQPTNLGEASPATSSTSPAATTAAFAATPDRQAAVGASTAAPTTGTTTAPEAATGNRKHVLNNRYFPRTRRIRRIGERRSTSWKSESDATIEQLFILGEVLERSQPSASTTSSASVAASAFTASASTASAPQQVTEIDLSEDVY